MSEEIQTEKHDFEMSPEVKELFTAMSRAQSKIKGALKDNDNPFFKSKYADLDSVWGACREALTENGLSIIQAPTADGVRVSVVSLLAHSSGQWVKSKLTVIAKAADPQAVGSAITYARRYAVSALTSVAPVDDDGNAASGHTEKANGAEKPPKNKPQAFPLKGVIASVKVRESDNGPEVWVELKDMTAKHVCVTGSEPAMSKLLDSEGQSLELLVSNTGKLTKDERNIHSVHQVFPLPVEAALAETAKQVKAAKQ